MSLKALIFAIIRLHLYVFPVFISMLTTGAPGIFIHTPNTALISVSKFMKPNLNLRREATSYNFKFQFTEFPRMIPGIIAGEVLGIRNQTTASFLP